MAGIDYAKLSDDALKEYHAVKGDYSKMSDATLKEVYSARPADTSGGGLKIESETPNLDVIRDVSGRTGVPEEVLRRRAHVIGMPAEDAGMLETGLSKVTGTANVALMGLPAFAEKKLGGHDEHTQQAMDELEEKLNARKSGVQKAAEIGASILTPIPGAGIARAASSGLKGIKALGAQIARGAGEAAVAGGATALTSAKTGEELDALKEGASSGLKVGAGIGALGSVASKAGEKLLKSGDKIAESLAYRTTGGKTQDINKLYNVTPQEIGRTLLDEGLIRSGTAAGSDEMRIGIGKAVDKFSNKEDVLLKQLDKTNPNGVSFSAIRERLLEEYRAAKGVPEEGSQKYAKAILKQIKNLEDRYAPTRTRETVVGRPQEKVTPAHYATSKKEIVVGTNAKDEMVKISEPDGMGGFRTIEVPRTAVQPHSTIVKEAEEFVPENIDRGRTKLESVSSKYQEAPARLSFEEAADLKRQFNKSGKYTSRTDAPAVEASRKTREIIMNTIDDAVEETTDSTIKNAYKADRMQSKKLLDALSAVRAAQKREQGNNVLGLGDLIIASGAGGSAIMSDDPTDWAKGAALLGAKKLGGRYGASASALAIDSISKKIRQNPLAFGRFGSVLRNAAIKGPAQLQATHEKLSQSDPEYAATVETVLAEP